MQVQKINSRTPEISIYCTPVEQVGHQIQVVVPPDTGADISACGVNLLTEMKNQKYFKLLPDTTICRAANGTSITTRGIIQVKLELENQTIYTLYVTISQTFSYLGGHARNCI